MDWRSSTTPQQASSSSASSASKVPIRPRQINESLFELHKPAGTPQLQVLFFHGLQFENSSDIHLSTWECGDGSCWPQTWLVEKFPDAHVLCVSYNGSIRKNPQGVLDMYRVGENLTSDLTQEDIGQILDCPIILVGHSFGGLVLKQVCIQAHHDLHDRKEGFRNAKLQRFLGNVRGIFYYATPHHGSKLVEKTTQTEANPLLTYFASLSAQAARLNFDFDNICGRYGNWRIFGLGEGLNTKLGRFKEDMMVPEASARVGTFYTVSGANHFSICKPESRTSASYLQLVIFLEDIAKDARVEAQHRKEAKEREYSRVDNLQLLPKSLVGIEVPTEAIIGKLEKAATVGIVGMGGLGKTTLAKNLFNKLASQFDRFEYSCFVPKVKEIKGTMEEVKEKVWKFMHKHGKKVGGEVCWSLLWGKQLFLVLDDISEDREVSLLSNIVNETSSGSRVVVTTRDQNLLERLDDVYNMSLLEESVARELFSSHAFGDQGVPSSESKHLVEKIVRKCDGLPLALEVVGKSLYRQGYKEDWEQTLCALVDASDVSDLNKKLWASLKISYDRLSQTEQNIFLDVTTFFSGHQYWTLRDAKAAWRIAYDTKTEKLLWKTLVDLSLVYNVEDHESIKVHEQLQSLGRKIASQRGVWDKRVGLELLQRTNGLKDQTIYSLQLDSKNEEIHIASSALQRLEELHYLDAGYGIIVDGAPRCDPIPTKLILLNCGVLELSQVLVNSTLTKRLVGLKLELREPPKHVARPIKRLVELLVCFRAKKKEEERLVEEIGQFSQLEVLHLTYCGCHTLPDKFGQLVKLRRLALGDFGNLCTLPTSFGQLKALSRLELIECHKLRSLPDSFGELSSLVHLRLEGCDALDKLPASFGQLKALSRLEIRYCSFELHSLPDTCGELSSLHHLELDFCPGLDKLPASFGQLKALRYLKISCCLKLHSLPDSFGELSSLQWLAIQSCGELDQLPASFGQLNALNRLEIMGCAKLRPLPDSFGGLRSLDHLVLRNCHKLDQLPASFGQLKALNRLEIMGCAKLRSLPDSFGGLRSLDLFTFTGCDELDELPASFGELKALSHLELTGCHRLRSLPDSCGELSSLNHLEVRNCDKLRNLPESFGKLKALSHLEINCFKIQSLPESFGEFQALKYLKLECGKLRSLPDSFGELRSLNHLAFWKCDELAKLPLSFGELKALRDLTFYHCRKLHSLPDSFGELSFLNHLEVWDCDELPILPESFGKLKALSHLKLNRCHKLRSLPDSFGELSSLVHLEFRECYALDKLPASFGQLEALSRLEIYCCSKLCSLPDSFGDLSSLNHLEVSDCDELPNLPESFGNLKALRHLNITNCFKLKTLPESFRELQALNYLKLAGGEKLQTLPNGLDDLKVQRVKQYEDRGPTLIATSEAPSKSRVHFGS